MTTRNDNSQAQVNEVGLLQRSWKWLVLRGSLALVLGGLAITFPARALFAFTLIFAAFAAADGLVSLMNGVSGARGREDGWWVLILRGLVGIAAGVVFALMPFVATLSYAFASLVLLSSWSIFTGVFEIGAAVRLRKEIKGEWLLGLSGLLSVLLGLAVPVVLALYPAATILSVGWMIGVYALAAGLVLIVLGLQLRRRDASSQAGTGHDASPLEPGTALA